MPGSDETVATRVGATVYETPKRIYNPVTEEYERIDKLSEDGYKRRFLALRHTSQTTNTIDLDSHPVAHFDAEKWECREQDGDYILIKRDAKILDDTGGER